MRESLPFATVYIKTCLGQVNGEALLSIGWDFKYSPSKHFIQARKREKRQSEAPVTHN